MSASKAGAFSWTYKEAKGGGGIWYPPTHMPIDPLGDPDDAGRDELVDAADFAEHLGINVDDDGRIDPDSLTEEQWVAKYGHEIEEDRTDCESDLLDVDPREMTEDQMAAAANAAALRENARMEKKEEERSQSAKGAAQMKQERDRYLKVGRFDKVIETLAGVLGMEAIRMLADDPTKDSTLAFTPKETFLPLLIQSLVGAVQSQRKEIEALRVEIASVAEGGLMMVKSYDQTKWEYLVTERPIEGEVIKKSAPSGAESE